MSIIDTALDKTLIGYTKIGSSARGLDSEQLFPEVAGKHIMVTGATGGIGKAAAERLAANGAIVHAVGRNDDKLSELADEAKGTIVPHKADLSLMSSIVALTERYMGSGEPLHGLINNVGVMSHERTETGEGFELTFATNLLGQYILTRGLLPVLMASAPSRIVMVSSGGMYSQGLTVSNLQSTVGEYNGTNAYARTKRAEVVLAEEWATSLADMGVTVNSMHPGWVDTDGVKTSLPTFRRITGPFLRGADQGADTAVWLVASDDAAGLSGSFVHDRQPRPTHRMKKTVEDAGKRERFMEYMASTASPWLEPSS